LSHDHIPLPAARPLCWWQEVIDVITLESTLVIPLAILMVLVPLVLVPPLYRMTRDAARLEVLTVYENLGGSALCETSGLCCGSARTTGLQTSPQRIVELVSLVQDYWHWCSRWLEGLGAVS
jgi:hypothetical protein